MRLEYIRNVDSTIISNISTVQVQPVEYESLENSLRPVGYKRHTFSQEKWELVTKNDEIDELAVLLAAVYDDDESQCLLNTVAALSLYHIDSPLPVPELSTEEIHHQKEYVNVILSEAIGRAKQMSPMQLKDIKPQPFLHFWDCGGQSVFLEILPAFLTARTMFFLLFDASKSFEEKWKGIRTFSGTSVCDETGNTTTKDLLFNWMANIHHHLAQLDEREAFRDYPRIYCIGTHGDMVENEKQAEVVKGIKDQYKGKAFAHLIKDTLIVDNTTAGSENEDNNFQLIRSEVNNFTLEKLIVKTPVSWILFRKVIQMLDTKVISLKEAHAIGLACKIPHSDVPKVLLFYHDLGALLYYPYINGLQNKVFINPKWFVDTVGKIFTLEGREEKDTAAMWLLLREKGILVKPLYSAVWKDCPEIEPDDMMELLVHFRLAAEVKTEEFYIQEVKQFFLPAVLKSFDGTPRFDDGGSYHATFLHITFSTNFVPPGFFTRFITSLAKSRLCELSFENGVFRNHVTFKFGEPRVDDVTLTDLNDAIQVSLVRYSDSSNMKPFDEICRQLLHVLANCGNEVDIALSSSRNDCSIKIARKFCYICASLDCKEYEPHYLLPAASGQTSDLPLYCQKRKVRRRPTREEAFWFVKEQVTENVSLSLLSYIVITFTMQATSRRIDHTEMFTISDAIGDKADDLAANLNMLDKLRVIQQNQSFRSNPVLQLLFDWDRGGGNREDLIAALKRTKLHHLADQYVTSTPFITKYIIYRVASANYMRRKSRPESVCNIIHHVYLLLI